MTITCTNLKTQQWNVYSQFLCKVSELQELCSMCNEKEADIRITTKKLAMVSLLTVFKDIIPGWVHIVHVDNSFIRKEDVLMWGNEKLNSPVDFNYIHQNLIVN